jgi:hypothetical protein
MATALPPEFQAIVDQALTNAAKGLGLLAGTMLLIVLLYCYVR